MTDKDMYDWQDARHREFDAANPRADNETIRAYWTNRCRRAELEILRLRDAMDTPEQHDFLTAAVTEAQYQKARWSENDAQKTDSDWFWLIGYLVGKAMHDVRSKRVHHLTAAAAALANWHAAALARGEQMPEERGDQQDHTGRLDG